MLTAVQQVYGVSFTPDEDPIRQVVPNGKTDRQIVREMLEPRGIAPQAVDAGFPSSSASPASTTPPRVTRCWSAMSETAPPPCSGRWRTRATGSRC